MEEFQDLRLPFRFFTLTFTLFLYFGSEPVGAGSGSGIRYLGVGAGSGSRLFKFLTGSASLLTLRIFLIFHLCGQFIKNWKNLKFLNKKIKVVENLTGIISIYLTLNLEEKNFPLSHLTLRIFLIFHLCGKFSIHVMALGAMCHGTRCHEFLIQPQWKYGGPGRRPWSPHSPFINTLPLRAGCRLQVSSSTPRSLGRGAASIHVHQHPAT